MGLTMLVVERAFGHCRAPQGTREGHPYGNMNSCSYATVDYSNRPILA
jgi:hypothetical protein